MQHTLFVCLFVAGVSGQPIDLASKRQATIYDPLRYRYIIRYVYPKGVDDRQQANLS
jgi:hypothetical protein